MKYLWVILSFMLLMSPFGCSGSGGGNHLAPGMHRVEYEVSTSITNPHVSITYIDDNGKTQELNDIDANTSNWTYIFSAKSGTYLYLSSALHTEEDGTIQSTIYVDHQNVEQALNYLKGLNAVAEYTIPAD
jgi:hypothetical protein